MTDRTAVVSEDSCQLCDLPLPTSPIRGTDIGGAYCCQGCLAVAKAIEDGAIPSDEATDSPPEPDTLDFEGESTFLTIDGMHCTTCESFLEKRAASIHGITGIVTSYATETARVYYDPETIETSEIPDALSGYGYTAKPRETGDRGRSESDPVISFLIGGGLFGMMVMVWYALFLYPTYFGMDPIVSPGGFEGLFVYANIWLFTSFVLFYTGWPILRGAVVSLLANAPNMDLLVAIAALSAYLYSTLAMLLGRSDLYFDVSVAIILVVTAGTYYEGIVKRRAIGELRGAATPETTTVQRIDGREVSPEQIQPGDTLLVRPGERIPYDSEIIEGRGTIDLSLLTGEAAPQPVTPGDSVAGGAVVINEPVKIRVSDPLQSTQDRLLDSMWTIQSGSPGIQRLADRLATIFVPLVLAIGIGVTALSLFAGNLTSTAILLGLTVLIVACPCALGLATPLGIASGVKNGVRRGLIFVNSSVFETAPSIQTIVFDKTGTLTDGEMVVQEIIAEDPEKLIKMAADVERFSTHPIASAIVSYAKAETDWTPAIEANGGAAVKTATTRNRGVSASIDNREVTVGHPALFSESQIRDDPGYGNDINRMQSSGRIPVVVGMDDEILGIISVGDSIRDGAKSALDTLAKSYDIIVLTGDEGSAALVEAEPSVDAVFRGVPPEGKVETIRRLRADGPVAMIGDGSNDAPALAEADLGVAVAEGTALAVDAADIIIAGDELKSVVDLFSHVDGTNRRIKQNLGWAFVYNGIAIPLAITGLLNPFLAAIAMATSSILVVSNSARRIGPRDR